MAKVNLITTENVTPAELASLKGLLSTQDGTAANPYIIASRSDLEQLRTDVANGDCKAGVHFLQTADIDMGDEPWPGIGRKKHEFPDEYPGLGDEPLEDYCFKGVYDGGGHSVYNLKFPLVEGDNVLDGTNELYGLFRSCMGATIRNLSVYIAQDGYGKDKKFGGAAIVGTVKDGITLVNCTAGGYLGSRENPCGHNAAGVIAYVCSPTSAADAGTFEHCVHLVNVTNNVNVFATRKVGGIIAFLVHDIILENVVNNGNVVRVTGSSRPDDGVGGIVGFAHHTTLSTYHLNGVANTGHVEVSDDAADDTKGSCGQLFGHFRASESGGSFNTGDIRLRFDKAALPLTRYTAYFRYLEGLRFKFGVIGADGLCHVVPELVDGGTYVYLIGKATDCALNLPAGAKVTIDQRFGVPTFQVGAGLDVHGEQEDGTDLWTYTVTAAS